MGTDQIILKDSGANSIEVSQNAKGDNAYKIKLYFSDETENPEEEIVNRIENIYKDLKERFK